MQVTSGLMAIEIRGSTIRYTYRPTAGAYELRGIPRRAIAMVHRAEVERPRSSVSKTIQYLTHLYQDRHYHAGTDEHAPRSTVPMSKLKPHTPYRDE